MSYHLINVLILHQELRYLYFYYQCELISAPKIMTLFPVLPSVNKNSERESSSMRYLLYLYLSGSVFLVSYTDQKQAII